MIKTVTQDVYMPWESRKRMTVESGEVVNMREERNGIDVGSQSIKRDFVCVAQMRERIWSGSKV